MALNPDDQKALAKRLGMKTREVVDAVELSADPPAVVVQTHDGQKVLVTQDDIEPWDGPMPGTLPHAAPAAPLSAEPPASGGKEDADSDPEAVPAGTAAEVLAWVGEDRDRATRALAAEQAGQKRTTLTTQLEKLAGLA